jgi:hypothetical protein
MKKTRELKEAYFLLERLVVDDLFCGHPAGEPARQFVLGAAAALDWALGNENRPFREMLTCIRKALSSNPQHGEINDEIQV